MEYLIVKTVGNDSKLYLDREGGFGQKSHAYPMPWWIAKVVLRSCFIYSDRFHIEEVRFDLDARVKELLESEKEEL